MTNMELADKLQKEAEHFSGAQDLVGMLWDAGATLRNLHTENTALRVTEDNLRQECQDQRRAAFRRIEELDAMRAQIGQCEPSQAASDAYDRIDHFLRQKLDDHDYAHYSFDLDLVWGAASAPQQKPLTDEQDRALCEAYCNAASDEYFKARPQLDSDVNRRIFCAGHRKAWIEWQAAHNIGEKK